MPLYDFEVIDQSGRVLDVIALNLPVNKRDSVTFQRVTVPQRITVMGSAPDDPSDLKRVDWKNLNKAEERLGTGFEKKFGMSKAKLKEVWERPQPKQNNKAA